MQYATLSSTQDRSPVLSYCVRSANHNSHQRKILFAVFVSTTPVNVGPDGKVPREGGYANANFDRSNAVINQYAAAAADVMEAEGVPIIDLHAFTASAFTMASVDSDTKQACRRHPTSPLLLCY